MRNLLKGFFTALMFLTRIPCPAFAGHAPEDLARSVAYFPLVGVLVGGIGALVYRLVAWAYAPAFAALCGIAATVIVTGAFHEDAFADVCDGFGGGTPERRLEIMRDSRVGSFAVIGLALLLGAKILLLGGLPVTRAPIAFLTAHTLARWSFLLLIARYSSRTHAPSLAKAFASSVTWARFGFGTAVTLLACLLWGPATTLLLFLATQILCFGSGRFFRRWIGGLSGDCLGAVHQIVETAGYAILLQSAALEAGARHLF